MTLSRLFEILAEIDGLEAAPDNTGVRGQGVVRRPDRRLANFPYDRDVFYGQPSAWDRGSSATGPLNLPLTPKDDSKFSLRIMGMENDGDLAEVLGSPELLSRAYSSDLGTSIPGVHTGWARNPPKDWDVKEGPLTIDPHPPDTEDSPNPSTPDFRFQTDDDLENRLDRIWGNDDNLNLVDPATFGAANSHIIGPDPWSVVNSRLSSRGLYGLMPKESAWDRMSGSKKKRQD